MKNDRERPDGACEGKTQVVLRLAEEQGVQVVHLRLSWLSPEDYDGVPRSRPDQGRIPDWR